jgi:putative spermidine/putrescine transport system ATP-binding protein
MSTDTETTTAGAPQRSSPAAPVVELRGVSKSFGSHIAVDHVDLAVADGEFFSLLGPSGSGKTTLLRLIAGFEAPTTGTVHLGGRDVTALAPFERDVHTVFQDYALFPHMSVGDNVAYGLRVAGVGRRERAQRAEEALRTVRLGGFGDRRPTQLSGGQRQRVALARALVDRPRVLLLDEPLGALDLKLRRALQIELSALQREVGITFVFVTHDQEEALSMSDHVAVVDEGRIAQVGIPTEIYDRPSTPFVAEFVGSSNFLRDELAVRLVGAEGLYSLRPERVRVDGVDDEPAPGDRRSVSGRVRDVAFTGPATRYLVALDDGGELTALRPHDGGTGAAPAVSDRVRLSWAPGDVYRVDAADTAGVDEDEA